MPRIRVSHRSGESLNVSIRGSHLVVDQPVVHGGADQGPTPAELVVAGIAAAAAQAVRARLRNEGLDGSRAEVEADFAWEPDQPVVAAIRLRVRPGMVLAAPVRQGVLEAAADAAATGMIAVAPVVVVEDPGEAVA